MRIKLFIAFVAGISFSCTIPNENDLPLRAEGFATPVVTGLRITAPSSSEVIALWGNPSDPPSITDGSTGNSVIPQHYGMNTPYPNPMDGSNVMTFSVPQEIAVNLWITPARLAESHNSDLTISNGATVVSPGVSAIRELLRNDIWQAGYYQVSWDGKDNYGVDVPSGFYRIYFQTAQYKCWRDIFLYRSLADIPLSLKQIVFPNK